MRWKTSGRRPALLLVLLPLFLLAGSAGCGGGASKEDPASPSRSGSAQAHRVVLIGLDGADWEIVDRLAADGRLPNLQRLGREGARGVLRSEPPLLSPIVWTTIATGRAPPDHGIVGFLTVRDGQTEPVRSDERLVRAFWNVASDRGAGVGVIGWYASWPAEPVNGFLVSDRVGYHQVEGTASPATTGLVYPDDLMPRVRSVREAVGAEIDERTAARFFSAAGETEGAEVRIEKSRLETFVGILRTTEITRRLAPALAGEHDPAILALYFEGTDSVGHLFAEFAPPPVPGVDPALARHLGPVFDRFYEHMDGVLGELVAGFDPATTTVMIVSDHGFRSGARRPATPSVTLHANQAPLWHRPEGVVLLWGRGVRRGVSLPEATIYDVVPTLFRAAGLPLAETLPGRPIEAAFTQEILARPPERVADYESAGERVRAAPGALPAAEEIARLEALGYVGGGSEPSADASGEATGEGQFAIPLNRYNHGLILMNSGREDEALEAFRSLARDAPGFPLARLGEGMVLIRQRRFEDAVAALEGSAGSHADVPALHATLGEAYLNAGRSDAARRSFRQALALDPGDGRSALLLAELLLRERDLDGAAALFDRAVRTADNPIDRANAGVGLAIVAETGGRLDEAERAYRFALEVVPGFPRALERYGNLELFRNNPAAAVDLLARLVAARPGSAAAHALHGRALAMAGRPEAARDALRRALAIDPDRREATALLEELATRGS